MGFIAYRIGACYRSVLPVLGRRMPAADADPVTLPPMTSTGGGPVIGGGGAARQMSQQLKSLGDRRRPRGRRLRRGSIHHGRSRCH